MIHGSSGSGHTLFVEPLETIHLNNELVRLHEEELREIHRLLREFTARLREHAARDRVHRGGAGPAGAAFRQGRVRRRISLLLCRASARENARRLSCATLGILCSKTFSKPRGKRSCRCPSSSTSEQRTLLISGPNTGGKTVALKTAGLLALMAHAGLAGAGRAKPSFRCSTRCWPISAIINRFRRASVPFPRTSARSAPCWSARRADSLVLLDELGRATDPEEGGALGVAAARNASAAWARSRSRRRI